MLLYPPYEISLTLLRTWSTCSWQPQYDAASTRTVFSIILHRWGIRGTLFKAFLLLALRKPSQLYRIKSSYRWGLSFDSTFTRHIFLIFGRKWGSNENNRLLFHWSAQQISPLAFINFLLSRALVWLSIYPNNFPILFHRWERNGKW